MTYDVCLVTKIDGNIKRKVVYPNMSENDAVKVAERMNRLNTLAARMTGKLFVYVFDVIKNGK